MGGFVYPQSECETAQPALIGSSAAPPPIRWPALPQPPHLVFFDPRVDLDSPELLGVRRLVNTEFTPKIATEKTWTNVPWPDPMQMEPVEPSDHRWLFVDESTWYFESR